MVRADGRALYQGFLPDARQHAFVWKYSQPSGGRRPRHFHREPELNLVVRGAATFGIGESVVNVTEGELLTFPAGQDHVLLEGSPDLYLYAIGLDPKYSHDVLGGTGELGGPLHVRLLGRDLDTVIERAAQIVDRPGAEQLGAELWDRIHSLVRHGAERKSRRTHVLTRRALQLIGDAPELGLDTLADQLRTHPSEVSRHFHRDMGMTLVRYRTRVRLLDFIGLVDKGHCDLMTAASAVGFGSYSQCHRVFRAELGCAPKQFFFSGVRRSMQLAYEG